MCPSLYKVGRQIGMVLESLVVVILDKGPTPKSRPLGLRVTALVVAMRTASWRNFPVYLVAILNPLYSNIA